MIDIAKFARMVQPALPGHRRVSVFGFELQQSRIHSLFIRSESQSMKIGV